MNRINIKQLINIAQDAGRIVLSIYDEPEFEVKNKADNSALTQADLASHDFICQSLKQFFPSIPIISEESVLHQDYEERKNWEYFFLVDPLDGTKEFIKRNGEFTINIALINKAQPILGVIHAPVLDLTYYAEKNKGAYKIHKHNEVKLPVTQEPLSNEIRVVMSRSHCCMQTKKFIEDLTQSDKTIKETSAGSALKFGLIAEGKADIYPRFSPTMEWDTAAGHVLVNETGKKVLVVGSQECSLQYNKLELINPGFIVQ